VHLRVPPLRLRRDDIPALAAHFLRRFNQRYGREVRAISPDALAVLSAYGFPGNVRELENLLERAYALGARETITRADLPALPAPEGADGEDPLPSLAAVERELILRALKRFGDDRQKAARALGISDRTIYRRLKEYGL
jgi:DNA-binding NtrC family response regulator